MENIVEPTGDFDFSQLHLENPTPLQGGNFFTKLNFSDKKLPLYIQLPKCVSKHGIIKSMSSKKSYVDLLFQYFETDLLTWFENLEITCRELIHKKKDVWFQTEMDLDDIENMFISPTKSYKSGKFLSIRVNIPYTKQIKREYCMIYDENESILDSSSITEATEVIPLIKIEGIKFSSKSFQLEINLPQLMVLSMDENMKKSCMIKPNKSVIIEKSNNLDNLEKATAIEYTNSNIETETKTKTKSEEISNQEITDITLDKEPLDNSHDLEITTNIQNKSTIENKENTEIQNLNELLEVDLTLSDTNDGISLKKPSEVYYEIYKAAREKAKHMKKVAIEAHLEARNIKTKYMLDDLNISEDEFSNYSEIEE